MSIRILVFALAMSVGVGIYAQGGGPPSNPPGKPDNPGKPDSPPGKPDNPGKPDDVGKPDNPGNSGNAGGSTAPKVHAFITWLTDWATVEAELKETGESTIKFKSSGDLTNVDVWLTPSLSGLLADPSSFAEITKDTEYSIDLTLEDEPIHTLGGTLHLRDGGTTNRSFAAPLPINLKVTGSEAGASGASSGTPTTVSSVTASTDYRSGGVTPLQTTTLFGDGIGPDQPQSGRLDRNGRVATYLGDTQVLFNGVPAPILAATRNQINVVAPSSVSSDKTVEIVVTHMGKVSQTITLPVASHAPGLFTIGATGSGQGAALNQDGSVNSPSNRAQRGTVLSLFGSGLGALVEPVPDGAIVGGPSRLAATDVSVTIGGRPARILYAGTAPGLVAGIAQLNVEVPLGAAVGDRVSVIVSVGGVSSSAGVTIAVQ